MNIKELINKYKITVEEAANACGVPFRTFCRYENNDTYGNVLKRNAIINSLVNKYEITEEKGILSLEEIKSKCEEVFTKHKNEIEFCYLFGSYAKGYEKENSDIDLLVSTKLNGFEYLGLIEELKNSLGKKIDLLRLIDQKDNIDLLNEILKDGIKIYG